MAELDYLKLTLPLTILQRNPFSDGNQRPIFCFWIFSEVVRLGSSAFVPATSGVLCRGYVWLREVKGIFLD